MRRKRKSRKRGRRVRQRQRARRATVRRVRSTRKPRLRTKTVKRKRKPVRVRRRPTFSTKQPLHFTLSQVQVISGKELFRRKLAAIEKYKLKRLGGLGKRIPNREIPDVPRVSSAPVPRGTLNRSKVSKLRVLVRSRIKGREAYFWQNLFLPKPLKGRDAKKLVPGFIDSLQNAYSVREYPMELMSFQVSFHVAA